MDSTGGFMSLVAVQSLNVNVNAFLLNFNSKNTRKAYFTDLSDFFKFCAQQGWIFSHPSNITLIHLIAYRDFLQQSNSKKTVCRKLASVRSLMKWLLDCGEITSNPASALRIPSAEVEHPTSALTDEEVRAMISAASTNPGHQLILKFLFTFGLRRSELINLKVSNIYTDKDTLVLRIVGKGDKTRYLPFNSALQQLTQDFIAGKNPDDYIFGNKLSSLTPNAIYKIFKQYAKAAGIDRSVSPHSARATAATKALENNVPITQVADDLGHADITTTQLYWKRRKGFENSMVHKLNY